MKLNINLEGLAVPVSQQLVNVVKQHLEIHATALMQKTSTSFGKQTS